jgi:hypothetical protein
MSPKRGDRVTVPPPDGERDVRFGSSEAARGWEELCRLALASTRRCLERDIVHEELRKALKDADYPADGKSLADLAQRNKAGKEVVQELKGHSRERFDGP